MSDVFLFERKASRWHPTAACVGPWSADALHAGPVAALCVAAAEEVVPGAQFMTNRLTLDLLRPVRTEPIEVSAELIKQGRRVSLIHVRLEQAGGLTALASVQRGLIVPLDLPPLAGTGVELTPPSDTPEQFQADPVPNPHGQLAPFAELATELRFPEPGAIFQSRPTVAWLRVFAHLLPGVPLSPAAAVAAAADYGNALGAPVPLRKSRYVFPNSDLTVHLARPPESSGWVRMAPTTTWDSSGTGQTRCALADRHGMLGTSVATLALGVIPGAPSS